MSTSKCFIPCIIISFIILAQFPIQFESSLPPSAAQGPHNGRINDSALCARLPHQVIRLRWLKRLLLLDMSINQLYGLCWDCNIAQRPSERWCCLVVAVWVLNVNFMRREPLRCEDNCVAVRPEEPREPDNKKYPTSIYIDKLGYKVPSSIMTVPHLQFIIIGACSYLDGSQTIDHQERIRESETATFLIFCWLLREDTD